jgi:hypothetical protein
MCRTERGEGVHPGFGARGHAQRCTRTQAQHTSARRPRPCGSVFDWRDRQATRVVSPTVSCYPSDVIAVKCMPLLRVLVNALTQATARALASRRQDLLTPCAADASPALCAGHHLSCPCGLACKPPAMGLAWQLQQRGDRSSCSCSCTPAGATPAPRAPASECVAAGGEGERETSAGAAGASTPLKQGRSNGERAAQRHPCSRIAPVTLACARARAARCRLAACAA